MHGRIWSQEIQGYDLKEAEIVISKLLSDPYLRTSIFDLQEESLRVLVASLNLVTVSIQSIGATLTDFIDRYLVNPNQMFLSSCEVTC